MFEHTEAFGGFSVDDVPAARAFYGETLGIRTSENDMGILTLHLAGGRDVIAYPKGEEHRPATFTILNFPVPDIEAAVDELEALGVQITKNDWTDERGIMRRGGPLIAWFADPAGNVLSVLEV